MADPKKFIVKFARDASNFEDLINNQHNLGYALLSWQLQGTTYAAVFAHDPRIKVKPVEASEKPAPKVPIKI